MRPTNFKHTKSNLIKFRIILFIGILFGSSHLLQAQVTIGSGNEPNANALLDLQQKADKSSEKGLLLPRVSLKATNLADPLSAHEKGMTVYNIGTSANTVDPKYYLSPGFYYNDGSQWVRLNYSYTNWFYMPSVSFDTSADATNQTKNLYSLYKSQFDGTNTANFVKSTGAPSAVPYIPQKEDLFYYITSYDANVFSNIKIDADGIMTYDVKSNATDCSYINIVFVMK